jgi:hypothetical protein
MKTRLIILIFCLGFFNNSLGQVLIEEKDQSPQEIYDFHIRKKKANNTAAWITLSGGIVMIVGGIGINMAEDLDNIFSDDNTNNNKGLWLSYLGGATALSSIPLFVAKGKHKEKAKIQLEKGVVGFDNKVNYTGISIVFSF